MSRPPSRQPTGPRRQSLVGTSPRQPSSQQVETPRPVSGQGAARSARPTLKAHSVAAAAGRLIVGSEAPVQRESEKTQKSIDVLRSDTSKADAPPKVNALDASNKQNTRLPGKSSKSHPKASLKSSKGLERHEVEELQRRLFELADRNKSGSIQFEEFATQHRVMINLFGDTLTGCSALAKSSTKDLEREFRKRDTDFSMGLDFGQYAQYMDSIHAVLGHRSFIQVCHELLSDAGAQKRGQEAELAFDAVASDLLLEKSGTAPGLHGHLGATVEQLLMKRADPNGADAHGNTVLILCADKAGADLMAKLLSARADPSRRNRHADCALLRALRSRNLQVARLLLSTPLAPSETGQETPPSGLSEGSETSRAASAELVKAMAEATERDVRELLSKRADVNHRDESGWTALVGAVFWGRKDCVEVILKHHQQAPYTVRLKVDAPNSSGLSPLHIAARKGRDELIPLLVSHRCNPDLRDSDGWTPLHHATFNGKDGAVQLLLKAHADVQIKGKSGFTPWMVSMLPAHAGELDASTVKEIDPNERVNFSKQIIPILGNASLKPYEKLEALFNLPGVHSQPGNLRLYDHFFSVRTGPNKVRLQRMWDGLACHLLLRLRTGETDVDTNLQHSEEDLHQEQARRQQDQEGFLRFWFQETMGPPPSQDWQHDNREAYRSELQQAVAEELRAFQQELTGIYGSIRAQEEDGDSLCSLPHSEVLRPEYLTQLSAHPILTWIDMLDAVGAFHALCSVKALGGGKDMTDALQSFEDLVAGHPDFQSGEAFWSNVYKLWLHHYALIAQPDFQRKVSSIVAAFNNAYGGEGLAATVHPHPVKSYERMKAEEPKLGVVRHDTQAGRWVASRILDVMHATVVVNSPRAVTLLLDEFFRPLDTLENRAALVQVLNGFNPQGEAAHGHRDLVLNVMCDGGVRSNQWSPGASPPDLHVALVGEVRITLQEVLWVKKRMQLITDYISGAFDHELSQAVPQQEGPRA